MALTRPKGATRELGAALNVLDFGATGDGVTDDGPAIQLAITQMETDNGGSLYFPAGVYKTGQGFTITEERSFRFFGDSPGNTNTASTEIKMDSGSSDFLFNLRSCIHFEFENLLFTVDEDGATSANRVIKLDALDSPSLSCINITFTGCGFKSDAATPSLTESVWIYDCVLTRFDDCWFVNNPTALRIGENAGVNSTLGNGNASQTSLTNCYSSGDIQLRRLFQLTVDNMQMTTKTGAGGATCVFGSSGDGQDRNVSLRNIVNTQGDGTRNFYTQGVKGENLNVENCRLDGLAKGFVLNGEGGAVFQGNHIQGSDVQTFVEINDPAVNVRLFGNDTKDAGHASFVALDDNTTSGSANNVRQFWRKNTTLASDQAFVGTGFSANAICTISSELDAGYYQVNAQVEVDSNETALYQMRFVVDGVAQGAPVKAHITSGDTATLALNQVFFLGQENSAVDFELECSQGTNTTPSDMKATASFMQVYATGAAA